MKVEYFLLISLIIGLILLIIKPIKKNKKIEIHLVDSSPFPFRSHKSNETIKTPRSSSDDNFSTEILTGLILGEVIDSHSSDMSSYFDGEGGSSGGGGASDSWDSGSSSDSSFDSGSSSSDSSFDSGS